MSVSAEMIKSNDCAWAVMYCSDLARDQFVVYCSVSCFREHVLGQVNSHQLASYRADHWSAEARSAAGIQHIKVSHFPTNGFKCRTDECGALVLDLRQLTFEGLGKRFIESLPNVRIIASLGNVFTGNGRQHMSRNSVVRFVLQPVHPNLLGLVQATVIGQGTTQILAGGGTTRVQFQGETVVLNRLVKVSGVLKQVCEIVVTVT